MIHWTTMLNKNMSFTNKPLYYPKYPFYLASLWLASTKWLAVERAKWSHNLESCSKAPAWIVLLIMKHKENTKRCIHMTYFRWPLAIALAFYVSVWFIFSITQFSIIVILIFFFLMIEQLKRDRLCGGWVVGYDWELSPKDELQLTLA